jgi:short-subunit dehydrogenase
MTHHKVAVVTGATQGIGKAIVLQFAQAGFNVAFCSRNADNVNSLAQALNTQFPNQKFVGVAADMSLPQDVQQFCNEVKNNFENIDVLINNAGTFVGGSMLTEPENTLETLINTNLYSAYHATRLLAPVMITQGSGYIFNICSIASIQAYAHGGSYSVSKFALLGFTKSLREELKPHNIRVTAVLPGATLTQSWAGVALPAQRFMPAEDIAQSIFDIYNLSPRTVVEELILRPQLGDI